MEDLETRYFERVHAAQTRHNEAMDAARSEHDLEVMAAREELHDKASQRFNVLFGKSATPAPNEAAKTMIESMIDRAVTQALAAAVPKMIDAPMADEPPKETT